MNHIDIFRNPIQNLVRKLIRKFTEDDLRIAIPAKVVKVSNYESKQVVDVKPVLNYTFPELDNIELTTNTIPNVFVKLQEGGGFKIKLPVKVGDLVTLHWSHKDLDEFLNGDGQDVTQSKTLTSGIEDCWVELGFGTRKNNQSPSQTDLIIEGDSTQITITPEGILNIETSGTSKIKSSAHTIDTNTTITGNLIVQGMTTSVGVLTASSGVLAPSYGAPAGGGGGTMEIADVTVTNSFTSPDATITGDAVIGGISYLGHKHLDAESRPTDVPF